jgi:hypothetical protein
MTMHPLNPIRQPDRVPDECHRCLFMWEAYAAERQIDSHPVEPF